MKNLPETEKIMAEGERLRLFTESDGWRHVKSKLEEKLNRLASIESLPSEGMDYEKIGKEMKDRLAAISLVREWLGDIESEVNRYKANQETMGKEETDEIVKRF